VDLGSAIDGDLVTGSVDAGFVEADVGGLDEAGREYRRHLPPEAGVVRPLRPEEKQ